MAIFTLSKLAVSVISLFLARRVYWELTTGARRRVLKQKHGCLPAKILPAWDPLFNLDRLYEHFQAYRKHRALENWAATLTKNNAHTLVMRPLTLDVYFTDEPENVKTMLATDFDVWSLGQERIASMESYLGKGVFTNEGMAWKHSREMLRPCFERTQVADVSILDKHTERLIKAIPSDGSTVDLQPMFHLLTLDIATEFLFGRSTDALDPECKNEDVKEFIEAFEYCQNPFENENSKKWGFIGSFFPDSKTKRCARQIQEFAEKIIDEEIASKSVGAESTNRYVFLDELLSVTDDRAVIRSELLHILLAGRDTTASLLSNLFFELPRHPDILARLRREIAEHVGVERPTYQQLKDMKYLKAIINEIQRLYPIVPANSREALVDTVLPKGGGPEGTAPLLIPKGGYMTYIVYSMHRRPEIFGPDAEEFNPERWLSTEDPLRPGWAYLPFSGGPRICIGQNFALTEASYVTVRMLQEFPIFESRDDEPWREKLTIVCSGLGGAKVGLKASH